MGRALFDTGMGERYRRDAETALPANKFGLQWFKGMDIATRLRAIDIAPESIDWIVNSHLHISGSSIALSLSGRLSVTISTCPQCSMRSAPPLTLPPSASGYVRWGTGRLRGSRS